MIRLVNRMIKNLDRLPTSTVLIITLMPVLAGLVGARDVAIVWTIVMWGLLIYLAVRKPD